VANRSIFIGDSHTCGYKSILEKSGPGTYSYWNENNYAEIYSVLNSKPGSIYSMAGVNNRVYTDWLKFLVNRHSNIDEAFICLAPLNRFCLGFDSTLGDEAIPVENFSTLTNYSTDKIEKFCDLTHANEKLQLFNKPTYDDYSKFPGIELSAADGLITPDLRKHSYMQIKLFFELNSFIEKRDFLLNLFAWDKICAENNIKLYVFQMADRSKYPSDYSYYGKLTNTVISSMSVEKFFSTKLIDHKKFLIEDNEHYNVDYHTLIAEKFLPWLKSQSC
jgi:hypothetical protein